MLLTQLREQVNNDDITKNLVGHLGSEADTFIEDRMKRHKDVAEIIRQNLTAQENILSWGIGGAEGVWFGFSSIIISVIHFKLDIVEVTDTN